MYERHTKDSAQARDLNAELVELDRAVIGAHEIPGLKWAMRARGAPCGHARSPHQPLADADKEQLRTLVPEG